MLVPEDSINRNAQTSFQLCSYRRLVWFVSSFAVLLSLVGLILCLINPSIRAPLRPGLDFTGGTQIQIERECLLECRLINSSLIEDSLTKLSLPQDGDNDSPSLLKARVQLLDGGKSIDIRLPFLSASQGKFVINSLEDLIGPFKKDAQSVETIGPSLGGQLLKSSLISLFVAFLGIALYISIRYDSRYAFLALIALIHDITCVCGIFAWLGLFLNVEVDSLFAVALLTIAGYSVNDTVVVFDRIRERSRLDDSLRLPEQVNRAVSSTLTRTLYTSGTTLIPLIALIIFGGSTLYWFAVALAIGVLVGSWSSIALAPSLLSIWAKDFAIEPSPQEALDNPSD